MQDTAFLCPGFLEGISRWSLKDAEMPLLFVYLKACLSCWCEEQMKVIGRRQRDAVVGKANRMASAAGSPYYQCQPFMQL